MLKLQAADKLERCWFLRQSAKTKQPLLAITDQGELIYNLICQGHSKQQNNKQGNKNIPPLKQSKVLLGKCSASQTGYE